MVDGPTMFSETVWLRRFAVNHRATMRLVCFPHAGGAASAYFNLAQRLPQSIETYAIQYPGRENRIGEPPLLEIGAALDGITKALSVFSGRDGDARQNVEAKQFLIDHQ